MDDSCFKLYIQFKLHRRIKITYGKKFGLLYYWFIEDNLDYNGNISSNTNEIIN